MLNLHPSLDIALALAANSGLSVFPCGPAKRPAIKGGNGFLDASTDPDRVREMWDAAGDAAVLVGVPTGPASVFDVLDLDPRHGSDDWRAANIHRLPETRIHATPGLPKIPTDAVMPGEHWLFRHVDGVRNSASKRSLAPGVDVRGEGGYVCFPPSAGYRIVHRAVIAAWPDWLLPLVLQTAEPATSNPGTPPAEITDARVNGIVAALLANVRNAADGAKHYTLRSNGISLGGYLHLTGWSEAQAVEQLVAALPATVKDWKLARRTAAWAVAAGR
jgi:hypothetical protein